VDQVLAWADAHRAATGRWPGPTSGAIAEAPGESWQKIDRSLRKGQRGLPRGMDARPFPGGTRPAPAVRCRTASRADISGRAAPDTLVTGQRHASAGGEVMCKMGHDFASQALGSTDADDRAWTRPSET
jgi:hypothetical protein